MFSIQNTNNQKITFTHLPNFRRIMHDTTRTHVDVLEEGELITVKTSNPNVIRAVELYIEKKVYCTPSEEILFTRRLREKDDVFLTDLLEIAEKMYCEHLHELCTKIVDERITKNIHSLQIKSNTNNDTTRNI
jgi:hypothetical protein